MSDRPTLNLAEQKKRELPYLDSLEERFLREAAGYRDIQDITDLKMFVADGADIGARGVSDKITDFNTAAQGKRWYPSLEERLRQAAGEGNITNLKTFIADGADIEDRNIYGVPPLHIAAGLGQVKATEVLIDAGADLEAKAARGRTPLHIAVEQGRVNTVATLINVGADLEAKQSMGGNTPLHRAARLGYTAITKMLVNAGADLEAKAKECLDTPLSYAVSHGNFEIVEILMEAGADLAPRNSLGRTPLSYELRKKDQRMAVLLQAGILLQKRAQRTGPPASRPDGP